MQKRTFLLLLPPMAVPRHRPSVLIEKKGPATLVLELRDVAIQIRVKTSSHTAAAKLWRELLRLQDPAIRLGLDAGPDATNASAWIEPASGSARGACTPADEIFLVIRKTHALMQRLLPQSVFWNSLVGAIRASPIPKAAALSKAIRKLQERLHAAGITIFIDLELLLRGIAQRERAGQTLDDGDLDAD